MVCEYMHRVWPILLPNIANIISNIFRCLPLFKNYLCTMILLVALLATLSFQIISLSADLRGLVQDI